MPHSCSEPECVSCWLVSRNVIVFNVRITLRWDANRSRVSCNGPLKYPQSISEEVADKVAEFAAEWFYDWEYRDKKLDDGDGIHSVEPFYSFGLYKLHEKDRFTVSFVTFPKPKARAPINQDPRASATTALPPVAPEEGDDPSDASE